MVHKLLCRLFAIALVLAAFPSATAAQETTPTEERHCAAAFPDAGDAFGKKICERFSFDVREERVASVGQHRLVVVARHPKRNRIGACHIAKLIEETEALESPSFYELNFKDVAVVGTLLLDSVSPKARITFSGARFLPPNRKASGIEACSDPRQENADASVHIRDSRFLKRLRFENTSFLNDVIISRSVFDHDFDLIDGSDVAGDLVLEANEFASNIDVQDLVVRGQLIFDDLRVGGDMRIEEVSVIDTIIDEDTRVAFLPVTSNDSPATPLLEDPKRLSKFCECVQPNNAFRLTEDSEFDRVSKSAVQRACRSRFDVPRCARSGGKPLTLEITQTDVAGLLLLRQIRLETKTIKGHPSATKYPCFQNGEECVSSHAQIQSHDVSLYDVSANGSMQIKENTVDAIYVRNSWFRRFSSEKNNLDELNISRNHFGNMRSALDKLGKGVSILRNDVDGSLEIDSSSFGADFGRLNVTHNRVGRDLAFTPNINTAKKLNEIDLSSNRVDGEFAVSLPVASVRGSNVDSLGWEGAVNLISTSVEGTLKIRFSSDLYGDGRMIADHADELRRISGCTKNGAKKSHVWMAPGLQGKSERSG